MVDCMLYKAMISSIRAWRSFESGSDLDGSGCQSSVAEVWRTSNCSPGASLPGIFNLTMYERERIEAFGSRLVHGMFWRLDVKGRGWLYKQILVG